ncbi:dynein-1-beta heavy chain, flagellar inner arm I1 complex isoform X1 [Neodiprion lecontei]|uniref:Dynein-1-beta heavy chain, flagellar inner arm I1 complex isoform X1 n=1 Tax=Neodiprion lecontei TaxID=441921 RepID=A0ABM3G6G9_NEOLC|nr:dynein-1-beta heavy chain, flagellar inner arm I1 complex isoform X1 [Neodiprion lecontei]
MLGKRDTPNGVEKATERIKKMEKPPADPHREYLDMDTDEEEFGKPETPEPEEEPPPEPEKPVFTDQELQQLEQYTKDFTVLPALNASDWNENCCKVIREFFQDPTNIILTIFYDVDVLKALLDFPFNAIEGLTYFLRSPWQIYTPENFHSTIKFGSISGSIENCVLKILENAYALGIFNSKDWPSVQRNNIFTNTHDLLTKLTDTTYKLMGLTILYVPKEGMDLKAIRKVEDEDHFVLVAADDESNERAWEDTGKFDEAKEEGELLGRLETVANFWIRQIREAIADQNPASKLERVTDELTFWNYRYDNLRGLQSQLQHDAIISIVRKLENVKFTSIRQFYDLNKSVQSSIDEAVSNINYLNLLSDPCKSLAIPEIQDEQITEILHLIGYIWLESPFFNTKEKIETLCQALSTQIVGACRESIDLKTIFQGETIESKKKVEVCISCCEKYKNIYGEHVEIIFNASSDKIRWEVDRENVFNCVDAFITRCQDVIEICDTIVVFGRSPKSVSFGGSNGARYESDCKKMENIFYENLRAIENVQHKILDVAEATWIEHITLFRHEIIELEVMVKNLINSIFDDTNCIKESIEALYILQRYNQRECVNELLHLKLVDIWTIFDKEIQQFKQDIVDHSQEYHPLTPYYSGRASMLRIRQTRLMSHQTTLIDASDWLGDCDAQIPVLRNYKKLVSAIANEEKLLFDEWEKMISDEKSLTSIFGEPLLRRIKSKFGPIEVNMDYHLLDTLEESKVWISLNFEVKPSLKKLLTKLVTIKLRYEGAVLLCRSYNRTFERISNNDERLLFSELLKNLDNCIISGFDKITWNSPDVEKFYADSTVEILNLEEFFGLYEKANLRIDCYFEEVANVKFLQASDNVTYQVNDFSTALETQKAEGMCKVTKSCNNILRLLTGMREGFEIDFEEVIQHWNKFIEAKDLKLKESLCLAVINSLRSTLRLIRGDGINIGKALFRVKVDYIGDELVIPDDIDKIVETFNNTFNSLVNVIKPLELLSKKLNLDVRNDATELWKSIERDDSCINLQEEINSELKDLKTSLMMYINSTECFKEGSVIDIAQIVQYYAANEPSREILEKDIRRCTKLADSIENHGNEVLINFLELDMKDAKLKLIEKCESWREILFIELSKVIVAEKKFSAATPTPPEELSLCSYVASDDSDS